MTKYQNGKIYKIVSPHTEKVYVGSTCKTLKARLSNHISEFKIDSGITSRHVLQFGDYDIVLIENHSCENVKELETRERFYIESMNCVNKQIPGRTDKQWRLDNALYLKEQNKEWRLDNALYLKEKNKEWRLDNAAAIRERATKKYDCDCGGKFTHSNTVRHKKSKKHLKYLESIN